MAAGRRKHNSGVTNLGIIFYQHVYLLDECRRRPVLTQLTCLWGPLRMCARAPSHAVLMASIDGVPSRSVIRSSYSSTR